MTEEGGERCPVCGGAQHPFNDDKALERIRGISGLPAEALPGLRQDSIKLSHTTLDQADFRGLHLQKLTLVGAKANGARFNGACLRDLNAEDATLEDSDWSGAVAPRAKLTGAKLNRARMTSTSLAGATLQRADLRAAKLGETDLTGANLENADVRGADLRNCQLDSTTVIAGARFDNCKIDRLNAEILADLKISRSSQLTLQIEDDVAALRLSFSGPWRTLHFIGLFVFLLPYLWHIAAKLVGGAVHCATPGSKCLPLWQSLLDYIASSKYPIISAVTFVLLLTYNLARSVLLLKAATLEHHEATTRMPPRFRLTGIWGSLYRARHLVYLNVVLAVTHAFSMLQSSVPR